MQYIEICKLNPARRAGGNPVERGGFHTRDFMIV